MPSDRRQIRLISKLQGISPVLAVLGAMALVTGPVRAKEAVTIDNFRRAETHHYFKMYVDKGCFARFCNDREAPAVDAQGVIRMNRDTPYSAAIFDLTTPVTIIKPDTGTRFQSMLVIDEDQYNPLVAYKPGSYTLTQESVGTRYVAVLFRTFMDPNNPADIQAAHAAQDAIQVIQSSPGKFEVPEWNQDQRERLSAGLASLFQFVPDSRAMFGKREQVNPERHLIGTAAGWGGNPLEDAKYLVGGVPQNDGETPYVLTVKDVPVDGFWSVTVYNAKGYFEAPETAISVNNVTGKKNKDGSMTIRFGGDPKADNYLRIMPGWSYIVRLYRPRPEILDGTWQFPAPTRSN